MYNWYAVAFSARLFSLYIRAVNSGIAEFIEFISSFFVMPDGLGERESREKCDTEDVFEHINSKTIP